MKSKTIFSVQQTFREILFKYTNILDYNTVDCCRTIVIFYLPVYSGTTYKVLRVVDFENRIYILVYKMQLQLLKTTT